MDVVTVRAIVKSLIFNIAFFTYCIGASLFFVWVFVLPRKQAWAALRYYFLGVAWVERLFLGLDFRVSGRENLPPAGTPFILAVKHYSAYETLKVPVIFDDIAIILKKELTWIPFWGWYTIKGGMIPVDRGGGQKAIASLIKGGKRVAAEGRPILIFPQGTRVSATDTTADKPYKIGIAKIAQSLNLPVVPVAINSGAFWAKHSFIKKGGIAEFKILPMIPAGLPATETLKQLESVLEPACAELMAKAKTGPKYIKSYWPRGVRRLFKLAVTLFVLWAIWWHALAYLVTQGAERMTQSVDGQPTPISSPHRPTVTGFPRALHIMWPMVTIQNEGQTITTDMLEATILPLPYSEGRVSTPQGFAIESSAADSPNITIDRAKIGFKLPAVWQPVDTWTLQITSIDTAYGATTVVGEGAIDIPLKEGGVINGQIQTGVTGYKELMDILVSRQVIDGDKARIANGFFDAMAEAQGAAGTIHFPFKITNNVAYAGFVRLFEITGASQPTDGYGMPPQKSHSGGLETSAPPIPAPQMPSQPPQP